MTRDDLERFEIQVRQSGDRVITLATTIVTWNVLLLLFRLVRCS